MFTRIGLLAARHARAVLVVTVVLLAGAAGFGFTAFGKLQTEGFTDPGAESTTADDLVDERFGGSADLVFLVDAGEAGVDDPAVAAAGEELTERLTDDPALDEVTSYFGTGAPPLRSDDGRYALIVAHLGSDESGDDGAVADLRNTYATDEGPIEVTLGGGAAVGLDIRDQVKADLALAEAIAVPLILILLLFAFGSLVAASLPLALGAMAVFGTFAALSVIGSLTDVSVFSINLTTALGLGLAVDYALLMVSRFREELAAGRDVTGAVVRTVETAGRTIAFSAATVAAALAVLLVFPLYFLRSFAYAGIAVVVIAMVSALLVLPALLAVMGPRVDKGRLPWARSRSTSTESTFWRRVAVAVTRRPVLTALPVVALLLLAAAPLLKVEFGTPDDRVLTTASDSRVVGDAMRESFPADDTRAIQVVTTPELSADAVDAYTGELSGLPGVTKVTATEGSDATLLLVRTDADPRSAEAQDLVGAIRDVEPPDGVTAMVGGEAARLVDSKEAIGSRLWFAAGAIAVIMIVLLFLFTGGILQPLRALLFNLFALSATLGLMVLVFQEGWFSSPLGFTPLPLDISMLVLLFCIAFGLSMDYEVFVVSRVKERHDAGAAPVPAVVDGLSHTGRIVTTAAILLAVNFFAFGTSGVSFIQMFGIGSGIAILIDATLVRGVLVPAGLALLGSAAWWAPRPLRRVYDRLGLREAPAEPAPVRSPENAR
ncbi:MMPL family transporter [Jiangella mangrovi]|uniref:RND superfamily putative drug exporter n=1 Tax=Jiangella mangrovi TaxID=1524084 RepID=A0A7W9GPF9_9ACTN|nr:MMPL family transporter [Jiangella mangrovi]MBB5787296.1 RND superfamily putative drug exporter [Jiangella mangrovi]